MHRHRPKPRGAQGGSSRGPVMSLLDHPHASPIAGLLIVLAGLVSAAIIAGNESHRLAEMPIECWDIQECEEDR